MYLYFMVVIIEVALTSDIQAVAGWVQLLKKLIRVDGNEF